MPSQAKKKALKERLETIDRVKCRLSLCIDDMDALEDDSDLYDVLECAYDMLEGRAIEIETELGE